MRLTLLALLCAAAVTGCVNTSKVNATGPDSYTVASTADGLRSASDARSSALEAANQHCTAAGKKIQVTNETQALTRMGIDTTYTVDFKCH